VCLARLALSFPWLTFPARLPARSQAMPSHIAGGFFTFPFVQVGGPETFDVKTSLAGAVCHNDRTAWEMLLSTFAPSEVAANYLR